MEANTKARQAMGMDLDAGKGYSPSVLYTCTALSAHCALHTLTRRCVASFCVWQQQNARQLDGDSMLQHILPLELSLCPCTCEVYMPHLSLIYGDLSDEEKDAVTAEFLAHEWSQLANNSLSFHVSSLALYRTNPRDLSMASWERLGVYPLKG